MFRSILCFLGGVWCGAGFATYLCDGVDRSVIRVRSSDLLLCGGVDGDGFAGGSVWMRKDAHRTFLFYKPVNLKESPSMKTVKCYQGELSAVLKDFPEDFICVLNSACNFDPIQRCYTHFDKAQYPLMRNNDLSCTIISGVQAALTESKGDWDGELQPRYGSWARYQKFCYAKPSDKEIMCTKSADGLQYRPGSIWVDCLEDMLCYKPEGGPSWLCYRHSLASRSAQSNWPTNTSSVRDAIIAFSQEEPDVDFEGFAGEKKSALCTAVRSIFLPEFDHRPTR